jgi:hypothetical protein
MLDVKNCTPEELLKVVADLQTEQVKLAERGDSLAKNLEEKTADLRAVNQAFAELKANKSEDSAVGSEREMRKYLKAVTVGGDRAVVLKGGFDSETKEHIHGLLDDPKPVTAWQKRLQDLVNDRNMTRIVWQKNKATPISDARIRKHLETAPDFMKKAAGFSDFQKAFADSSGVGAEWIIDMGLPTIARDERLVGQVAALFQVHKMAAQTELLPFLTTGLRAYKHIAGTSDDPAQFTSSSMETAQRTIAATGFVLRTQVDADAAEDAILAMMPFLNAEAVQTLAMAEEDCLINGDSTASHQDTGLSGWDPRGIWGTSGLGGSNDHRRTYIGLRARATDVSNTTDGASTETYAGLLAWRAKLKSPLGIGANIVHITSMEWALLKIFGMTELKTVDLFGDQATIKAGLPSAIAQARIVLSDFVDVQYTAAGIYDNSSKIKTGLITANVSRFWITERMGNALEMEKDITRGVFNIVARNRRGFFTPDASTTKNVHWAYNLSIA